MPHHHAWERKSPPKRGARKHRRQKFISLSAFHQSGVSVERQIADIRAKLASKDISKKRRSKLVRDLQNLTREHEIQHPNFHHTD